MKHEKSPYTQCIAHGKHLNQKKEVHVCSMYTTHMLFNNSPICLITMAMEPSCCFFIGKMSPLYPLYSTN